MKKATYIHIYNVLELGEESWNLVIVPVSNKNIYEPANLSGF
jgi:hypothetical protein